MAKKPSTGAGAGDGTSSSDVAAGNTIISNELKQEIAQIVSSSMASSLRGLVTVNEESISYRFGSIDGSLKTIDKKFDEQNGKINKLANTVDELNKCFNRRLNDLPCSEHGADIAAIMKYMNGAQEQDKKDRSLGVASRLNLRVALIAALTGSIVTAIGQTVFPIILGG